LDALPAALSVVKDLFQALDAVMCEGDDAALANAPDVQATVLGNMLIKSRYSRLSSAQISFAT
jgi:hypothetical protein